MLKCLLSCAALAVLLAASAPWLVQRAFWYAHQAPAEQARHTPQFPPDFHDNLVRGVPSNGFITERRFEFLDDNFTHVPGDVWITTYQKVGTTWTQYIVSLLLDKPASASLLDLFEACPWPEVSFGIISTPVSKLQASAASATGRRCFKSHWPRQDYFLNLPDTSKVIYVLRDVENVAVSYWNHIFNLWAFYWVTPEDMSWDQYFEKWFAGDTQMGGYFEHVASWWAVRERPNVLMLRYEDLRSDTGGTIRRIAEFIGVELSDARLKDVLFKTSKEKMQAWNEGFIDKMMITLGVMKGEHIRKDGEVKKVGFSDSQRARVVAKYESLLKPLGMPFEYMFAAKKK